MDEKIYKRAMEFLQKNYPAILKRSTEALPYLQGEWTLYDVVHDTVLLMLKDPNVLAIKDDAEFVDFFLYRQRTIVFREIHNKKLRFKTHANYHQAQKDFSEGDKP